MKLELNLNDVMLRNLNDVLTIEKLILMSGGTISNYPLIGKTVALPNGSRLTERNYTDTKEMAISYEFTAENKLCKICIGTIYHGIILQCNICNNGDIEWANCYSRGNYGKNYSHGGNWSYSKPYFATWQDAWKNRDYMVGGIKMTRNMLTENKEEIGKLLTDWLK